MINQINGTSTVSFSISFFRVFLSETQFDHFRFLLNVGFIIVQTSQLKKMME